MEFVGHPGGSLASSPRVPIDSKAPKKPMTLFEEHFLKTASKPNERTPTQTDDLEMRELESRIKVLQRKLLPFGRNIGKRVFCLEKKSHPKMSSVEKSGIDVKSTSKDGQTGCKYGEETSVENKPLRAKVDLRKYSCASIPFPKPRQTGVDKDSKVFLHKGADASFTKQSEACDSKKVNRGSIISSTGTDYCSNASAMDSDSLGHDVEHYLSELKRMAEMNKFNEARSKNNVELASDVQRMATESHITLKANRKANGIDIQNQKEQNMRVCPFGHEITTRDTPKCTCLSSRIPVPIKPQKPEATVKKQTGSSFLPRLVPAPARNGRLHNSSFPQQSLSQRPIWRPSYRVTYDKM